MKHIFTILLLGVSTLTFAIGGLTADFSASVTNIIEGDTVVFTNTSGIDTADAYEWTFPGGTPGTMTGQGPHTITYNTAGVYDVQFTITVGTSTADTTKTGYITVTAPTSVNELKESAQFEVYPIPSSNGILNVNVTGINSRNNTGLKIFSVNGEIVYEERRLRNESMVIDVSNFSSGTYIMELQDKKSVVRKSIVINN